MSFVKLGGTKELFRLILEANPSIPVVPNESNSYFPKLVGAAEAVTVTMAGRYGSGIRGYKELDYSRLDIGKLFKGAMFKVGVVEIKSIHEHLADIYESTGFAFDVSDVDQLVAPEGQTFPWRVTLKAAPTSFIYFGEATIEFVSRKVRLAELVGVRDVTVELQGVVSTAERERAELVTFGIDYTTQAPALQALSLGSLAWSTPGTPEALRCLALYDALNSVDRLPWKTAQGPLAWTLNGAKIVYNGKVSDYAPTWWSSTDLRQPNPRFDRVLVVVFEQDTTGPTGFYGSAMFIHYNSQTDNEVR